MFTSTLTLHILNDIDINVILAGIKEIDKKRLAISISIVLFAVVKRTSWELLVVSSRVFFFVRIWQQERTKAKSRVAGFPGGNCAKSKGWQSRCSRWLGREEGGPTSFSQAVPADPTLRGHKRQPWHGDRLSDTLTQPLNHRLSSPSVLEILISPSPPFFFFSLQPPHRPLHPSDHISVPPLRRFNIAIVIRRSLSDRCFHSCCAFTCVIANLLRQFKDHDFYGERVPLATILFLTPCKFSW